MVGKSSQTSQDLSCLGLFALTLGVSEDRLLSLPSAPLLDSSIIVVAMDITVKLDGEFRRNCISSVAICNRCRQATRPM